MKTEEKIEHYTLYTSDIVPGVATTDAELANVIAWADANPKVWRIVRENKSKEFGRNGYCYFGSQRGESPDRVLERAAYFRRVLDDDAGRAPFSRWCAQFTLDHYGEKGFKTGHFHQFDGTYDRGSAFMDYTPDTLKEVTDMFFVWVDTAYNHHPTVAIKLNGKIVRKYPMAEGAGK